MTYHKKHNQLQNITVVAGGVVEEPCIASEISVDGWGQVVGGARVAVDGWGAAEADGKQEVEHTVGQRPELLPHHRP